MNHPNIIALIETIYRSVDILLTFGDGNYARNENGASLQHIIFLSKEIDKAGSAIDNM